MLDIFPDLWFFQPFSRSWHQAGLVLEIIMVLEVNVRNLGLVKALKCFGCILARQVRGNLRHTAGTTGIRVEVALADLVDEVLQLAEYWGHHIAAIGDWHCLARPHMMTEHTLHR